MQIYVGMYVSTSIPSLVHCIHFSSFTRSWFSRVSGAAGLFMKNIERVSHDLGDLELVSSMAPRS